MLARRLRLTLLLPLLVLCLLPPATANVMPDAVTKLFKKHRAPLSRIGLIIRRLTDDVTLVEHRADDSFNPASVAKLITTMAAIDILGPTYRWKTTFATDGVISGGALHGNLYLLGGGDPYITVDRFLYMLHDLRNRGIQDIRGDLIIDDSVFALPPHDPKSFDGAPLKPYNVGGGGMLVNFKATRVVLLPQKDGARVFIDPPNDHITVNNKVRLVNGKCRNWRRRLSEKYRENDAQFEITLAGKYAKRCGEQSFYLSALSHSSYVAGVFSALWRRQGGGWNGAWRRGQVPADATTLAVFESPPLAEVLSAMNKHSNNVIARNLFLSLAPADKPRTPEGAQAALQQWLDEQGAGKVAIENGSGLSRIARATPAQMAHLLDALWRHPHRSDMISSLPILGLDGTLKKRLTKHSLAGEGRLKTGSLANIKTLGGFFWDARGRPHLIVFFAAGAGAARTKALQDDILKWARSAEG